MRHKIARSDKRKGTEATDLRAHAHNKREKAKVIAGEGEAR